MKKDIKHKRKKTLFYLMLAYFLYRFLGIFLRKEHKYLKEIKNNLKDFFKKEKKEVSNLQNGKESFGKYLADSCNIFWDYFIPHKCNNHKPKILHHKSLAVIVILVILLKASLTGYLFFAHPFEARMTEVITARILELVNTERVEHNLGTLKSNLALNISAHEKAKDMIAKSYFAHHSPDGKKPWDWIDRTLYKYLFVGENLAMNFTSADSAHRALMNSPTHKKNILNDRYVDVGLAMVTGIINGKKTNVLVQLFATTKPVAAMLAKAEPVPEESKGEEVKTEPVEVPVNEDEKKEEDPVKLTAKEDVEPESAIEPEPELEIVEQKPVEAVTAAPTTEEKELAEPKPLIEPEEKLAILAETSPNPAIDNNISVKPIAYENFADEKILFSARIAKTVNYIFVILLTILTTVLIVNIIIRVEIQHKHVIAQTMVVILFIASLIYFKFHILESGLPDILIL